MACPMLLSMVLPLYVTPSVPSKFTNFWHATPPAVFGAIATSGRLQISAHTKKKLCAPVP